MNTVKIFENQEIKIETDKGEVLINLASTAKVCGLVGVSTKDGGKYNFVRWSRVKEKLTTIYQSIECGKSSLPRIIKEINYILDEIENTDDRNTIYMSTWLSKRLALECHSEKAMRYKTFLVTLDESREDNQAEYSTESVVLAQNIVQAIIPTMATEIINQFTPMITETKRQINNMSRLMYDQSTIYDQDREELKDLIGLRAVNTKRLTDKLKEKLTDIYGFSVTASSNLYVLAKSKVFRCFQVIKWEDIPVTKYNTVDAFIDAFEKSDIGY